MLSIEYLQKQPFDKLRAERLDKTCQSPAEIHSVKRIVVLFKNYRQMKKLCLTLYPVRDILFMELKI
jgi:hypothetical protein